MNKLSYVPKPGIEGFPYDNSKARIIYKGAVPSVVERVGNSAKVIGKIVDNKFYSVEEYKKSFKLGGAARKSSDYIKPEQRHTRVYVKKKSPDECKLGGRKRIHPVPAMDEVKGIPEEYLNQKGIIIKNMKGIIYLVRSDSYRNDGKQYNKTTILGRIHDLHFYTTAKYKELFAPKHAGGRPKKTATTQE